jgi:hypothetical protein
LAGGDNDAALERVVDLIVRWAASPDAEPQPEPPPGGDEVRPTGLIE